MTHNIQIFICHPLFANKFPSVKTRGRNVGRFLYTDYATPDPAVTAQTTYTQSYTDTL